MLIFDIFSIKYCISELLWDFYVLYSIKLIMFAEMKITEV